MAVGIISKETKTKMLKNREDKDKLRQEIKERQAELGLRDMVALRNQDELQQLEDLKKNGNKIKETMEATREQRIIKEKPKKEAERRERMKMSEEIYFKMKERKEREEYEKRKITINR